MTSVFPAYAAPFICPEAAFQAANPGKTSRFAAPYIPQGVALQTPKTPVAENIKPKAPV